MLPFLHFTIMFVITKSSSVWFILYRKDISSAYHWNFGIVEAGWPSRIWILLSWTRNSQAPSPLDRTSKFEKRTNLPSEKNICQTQVPLTNVMSGWYHIIHDLKSKPQERRIHCNILSTSLIIHYALFIIHSSPCHLLYAYMCIVTTYNNRIVVSMRKGANFASCTSDYIYDIPKKR